MSTPEGQVKSQVKDLLAEYHIVPASVVGKEFTRVEGWYYMPGQNGRGVTAIPDYIGEFHGRLFAIETKAPGKKPTKLQQMQMDLIVRGGGTAFAVDGEETLGAFKDWIHQVIDEET